MVVTDGCLQFNYLIKIKLYRWFKSNKESQNKRTSKRVSFLFWFYLFDLNHQPTSVRPPWRTLIWEGADRRQWRSKGGGWQNDTRADKRCFSVSQYATICHSVRSLLMDVCELIIWLKLNYIVGSSPTRRATFTISEPIANRQYVRIRCFFRLFIDLWYKITIMP